MDGIKDKVYYLAMKFYIVTHARTISSKLKIFGWFVLDSIPRIVQDKINLKFNNLLKVIKDSVAKGTILDVEYGIFSCPDSASLLTVTPYYEYKIVQFLLNNVNIDDIFIDVGAHIGKYTVLIARRVSHGLVISLEPHPLNFKYLLNNIKLNSLNNVIALNYALSKESGKARLFVGISSETHSLRNNFNYCSGRYIEVNTITMDELIKKLNINKVDWIKIDVEGAEIDVLMGARHVLSTLRPKLIVEVHRYNYNDFYLIMKKYDYNVTPFVTYKTHAYYYAIPKD